MGSLFLWLQYCTALDAIRNGLPPRSPKAVPPQASLVRPQTIAAFFASNFPLTILFTWPLRARRVRMAPDYT